MDNFHTAKVKFIDNPNSNMVKLIIRTTKPNPPYLNPTAQTLKQTATINPWAFIARISEIPDSDNRATEWDTCTYCVGTGDGGV